LQCTPTATVTLLITHRLIRLLTQCTAVRQPRWRHRLSHTRGDAQPLIPGLWKATMSQLTQLHCRLLGEGAYAPCMQLPELHSSCCTHPTPCGASSPSHQPSSPTTASLADQSMMQAAPQPAHSRAGAEGLLRGCPRSKCMATRLRDSACRHAQKMCPMWQYCHTCAAALSKHTGTYGRPAAQLPPCSPGCCCCRAAARRQRMGIRCNQHCPLLLLLLCCSTC
jgi:hypothetical protein